MIGDIYSVNKMWKKSIIGLFLAIMLLHVAVRVNAKAVGARFLEISPSVKASAMGEAIVALEDVSAMPINPAGLAFLQYPEAVVTHAELYQENTIDYLAAVLPFRKKYAFGINFLGFQTPDEPVYDWSGNLLPGESITYSGSAFGVAGAMKLSDNFSVGINAKNIGEKLMDEKQDAFIADLGALIKYPLTNGRLQFGVAVNMGGQLRDDEDTPTTIRVGGAYIRNALTLAAELTKNTEQDGAEYIKLGGEYWINNTLAPRIGLKGAEEESAAVTIGFGIKWKGFYLDYAGCPNETLGATNKVALGVKFGYKEEAAVKKRKKTTAAKPARQLRRKQGETLKIAVADLDGKNVSAMDAAIVSDFIRTELVKTQAFTVLDRQNMERILEEQSFQLSGCTTEECAVQMGKILNVSYMAVGTFSKFLETYYINVNFIDVETGEIVGAETAECATGRELPIAAQELATKLAEQFGQ